MISKRIIVDVVSGFHGGEDGGIRFITIELLRRFTTMAPDREFILVSSGNTADGFEGIECENLRHVRLDTMSDTIRSGRMFGRKADLIFCPFAPPSFLARTIPVVTVVHHLQHLYCPHLFQPAEIEQRSRNFRRLCRAASRLICVSEYVRKTVLSKTKVPGERVAFIPIFRPTPPRESSPEYRNRVLNELKLVPQRFLVYPANFQPYNNHELLLTAFGMYKATYPNSDLKLVLLGATGPGRDSLAEASRRMGLSSAVLFARELSSEDRNALMECCRALIFPSLFEELGTPLLEAMVFGRPVLSSNTGSLPEMGRDAVLYFDPRKPVEIVNAIRQLETSSELRHSLTEAGLRRLSTLRQPEDVAARYLDLFNDAMKASLRNLFRLAGSFR